MQSATVQTLAPAVFLRGFFTRRIIEPLQRLWALAGNEPGSVCLFAQTAAVEVTAVSEYCVAAERALKVYGDQILRLCYSYLHNMDDAEEMLQETLIKRMTAAPSFCEPEHEKAWLFRVAANLCKNKLDYESRRRGEDIDQLSETLSDEGREDLSFVWDAVKSLPPGMREVVHLYYHEGFPTAQIARILGKNGSSVRSALRKGRLKLQNILKEAYDFD